MNKTQLIDAMSDRTSLSKAQAKSALDVMIKITAETLSKGEDVVLVGFGSFKVSERKARTGINPRTHERMEHPAKKVVRFKPGTDLKNSVQ